MAGHMCSAWTGTDEKCASSEEGQGANVSTRYACIFVLSVHVKSVLLQNLVAAIGENIHPVDNLMSDFKYISQGIYSVVHWNSSNYDVFPTLNKQWKQDSSDLHKRYIREQLFFHLKDSSAYKRCHCNI